MAQMPPPFMYPPCDPAADARALRTAMKGIGTDESTLIKIICNRSRDQLAQIEAAFKAAHGKDLRHEIKTEISGNFRKVIVKRFDQPVVVKAKALHAAMKGAGTNEARLIDCLAFTPNAEFPVLKQVYAAKAKQDLVTRMCKETSGSFKDCIKDISDGNRDEGAINPAQIAEDVKKLYKAGEGKIGTDEKAFIKVLCNHAPWYNVALNQAYGQTYKHDLHKAIEKEFSGSIKDFLCALCMSPYEYWADRIYHSMKGAGTDDRTLIFIVTYLERHELQFIAQLVKQRHGHNLKDMIKKDLSGHYEKAVLELCGF